MNRIALLAVGGTILAAGAGAGAFYFASNPGSQDGAALGPHNQHKSTAASDETRAADVRTQVRALVEELGAVQDRVIGGDRAALAEQSHLMQSIGVVLRRLEPENWNDYANVRAAFIYVLSGGEFDVLKPVLQDDKLYEADRELAEGIMSFARGEMVSARRLFDGVDPRSLDLSLIGPFALARASVLLGKDEKKAISLLDEARVAGPHTAIEEAAARREIPILMNLGETSRSVMLMADYARRFGKSIYAWKLFQNFAVSVAKRTDLDDAKLMASLLSATETAPASGKADLCLEIASQALLYGKIDLARAAAEAVLKISQLTSEQSDKARLYKAAADAPSARAAEALATLAHIKDDHLSATDVEIRDVAGFVARAVMEAGTQMTAEKPPRQKPLDAPTARSAREPGALEKAEAAMQEADKFISGKM